MTDAQQNLFDRLTDSWVEASRLLDIRVDAPFAASSEGVAVKAVAFLPDFGGPRGMVVGAAFRPGLITDEVLQDFAKRNHLFYSCLSVPGYEHYNEMKYKVALNDWGYFGPLEDCPHWFVGYNHTQIGITHRKIMEAWRQASRSLGLRVVESLPPLTGRHTFVAFLPDFGSPAGVILGATYPPGFDKDRAIEEFAKSQGIAYSFLSTPEYVMYDEQNYRELLSGLGYFGPAESRPAWLTRSA